MMLNLGSGNFPAGKPWINVDSQISCEPDVVASVLDLPFKDNEATLIYCGHLLEHLSPSEVNAALIEIRRVLTPVGRLCIVGPDYDRAVAQNQPSHVITGIRDGAQRWAGDAHLWLATEANTLEYVRQVFPEAQPKFLRLIDRVWPCPFRDVEWQFCILA